MNEEQAILWSSTNISVVTMAKISTFSNRETKEPAYEFYYATLSMAYDYGDTQEYNYFLPHLIGGSDFFTGISHVPKPNDTTSTSQGYNLYLQNGPRLNCPSEYLGSSGIEGADIEVSQLLLPDNLIGDLHGSRLNLWNYIGDEHTVLFRGRVKRMTDITAEKFTLECVTSLPDIANVWAYANDETSTDPIDLGLRLPFVYGNAKKIPAINYDVGWVTTLAESITSSETGSGYEISDGTGLPSGSFSARIDGEVLTCSTGASTSMTISSRGSGATAHEAGAVISEILSTTTYILNGAPSVAVDALYVVNPISNQLVRLDSSHSYTEELDGWVSGVGKNCTYIQFSSAQLTDLMDFFNTQGAPPGGVTQQPVFEAAAAGVETVRAPLITRSYVAVALEPTPMSGPNISDVVVQAASPPMVLLNNTAGGSEGGILYIPSGSAPSQGREIERFRVIINMDAVPNSNTTYLQCSFDFLGTNGSVSKTITSGGAIEYGTAIASGWYTPSGSNNMEDLERASVPTASTHENFVCIFMAGAVSSGGGCNIYPDSCYVECELVPVPLERTADVEVSSSGASTGYGLRFFSDLQGIEVPRVITDYEIAEDFESGTWSAYGCTAAHSAVQKYTGTNSLALTWDADAHAGAEVWDTDVITGWAGVNCVAALDAGEGHRASSTYALEGSAVSADTNSVLHWDTFGSVTLEGFESGTWVASNGAAAISATNPRTGTNSLAVTFDPEVEQDSIAFSTNSASGWTDGGPTDVTYETGLGHTEGSGCIKAAVTGGTAVHSARTPTFSNVDISDYGTDGQRGFAVDIYVHWGSDTTPSGVEVNFLDTGTGYCNTTFPADNFTDDAWHTIICSHDEMGYFRSSFDPTKVNQITFVFARVSVAGTYILIDNPRWIRTDTTVQNNAVGGVDMTAIDDAYSLQHYTGGDVRLDPAAVGGFLGEPILDCDMWLSSASWSSTTVGTDYWLMPMDPIDLREQWQLIESTPPPTEVGASFDITNINSMRLKIHNQQGVYTRGCALVHYFDDLGGYSPLTGPDLNLYRGLDYDEGKNLVIFDFKIKKGGSTGPVSFRFGQDADNYYHTESQYTTDDFTEDTWVTMILTTTSLPQVGGTGNDFADENHIDYFAVEFNQATPSATAQVYLDNVKTITQNMIAQNNAVGDKDFYSYQDAYKTAYYSTADVNSGSHYVVWFSDAAWTGTDQDHDTAYVRQNVNPPDLKDTWKTNVWSSAPRFPYLGGITEFDSENIKTLRILCEISTGLYPRDPSAVHYFDTLQKNTPDIQYFADEYSAMTHPADIMQHWITAIGDEVLAYGTAHDLISALGPDAEWGFDCRSLGFSWQEVLHRMAFEARCSVSPIDLPSGRRWNFLSASNNYGYGETEFTLTQQHSITDHGHDLEDLASSFSFRYAFDASLPGGGDESGYRLSLAATPTTSDVPITTAKLDAASKRFGLVEADVVAFRCIQDAATAQDAAGYYVQERIMTYRHYVYTIENVAWMDAMQMAVGDIVNITPPWENSISRCRITSMTKGFSDNMWTLTAISVRYSGEKT